MRTRIYVAGPYTKGNPLENSKKAIEVGNRLLEAGYAPFCPHLTHWWHELHPQPYQAWLDYDNEWLPLCHAVLRLPGESNGADKEVELANHLHIPVYHNLVTLIQEVPKEQRQGGDPRFHALLAQMGQMHAKKAADYGTDQDLFANIRASLEFGVAPWLGALIRLNDKVTRLKTFAKKRALANESVEDSLMDLAAYSLIALILFRERPAEEPV